MNNLNFLKKPLSVGLASKAAANSGNLSLKKSSLTGLAESDSNAFSASALFSDSSEGRLEGTLMLLTKLEISNEVTSEVDVVGKFARIGLTFPK